MTNATYTAHPISFDVGSVVALLKSLYAATPLSIFVSAIKASR
jgi:hypothetical protein